MDEKNDWECFEPKKETIRIKKKKFSHRLLYFRIESPKGFRNDMNTAILQHENLMHAFEVKISHHLCSIIIIMITTNIIKKMGKNKNTRRSFDFIDSAHH